MFTRRHSLGTLLTVGLLAIAALTGCTSTGSSTSPTPTPESTPSSEPTSTPEPSTSTPESESTVLVVYFSRPGENYWEGGRRDLEVGNTKVLGDMIAESIGADVYEIVPSEPYPDEYDAAVDRNRQEQEADARPGIAGELPDVRSYDTILLGSPVWSNEAPKIMYTFIESVDLSDKRVLPFVTYAVSGMSGIDADYRAALPDSTVADGLAIRGEEVAEAEPEVTEWLQSNELREP